jgi:hypothetical protein
MRQTVSISHTNCCLHSFKKEEILEWRIILEFYFSQNVGIEIMLGVKRMLLIIKAILILEEPLNAKL